MSQERANRAKGVNFVTQVGILLKLPQLTLATASVYLHRFYMRHSMVDLPGRPGLHHYAIAATALFLATKVEENCRKMRELVVACCRVAQKQPNLVVDEQSKEYWKWRDTILHNEDLLLEALCFDLQLEQPYRVLFDFLCYYGVQDDKNLRNVSWAYLNDSNLTIMCLLFPASVVAGSALYAAARFTRVSLPDDERGRPWWEHLGLKINDMTEAVNIMADAYGNSTLPRQGQKEVYVKDDGTQSDSTRLASSPNFAPSPARSLGTESQGVKRERDENVNGPREVENGVASPRRSQIESSQWQQNGEVRSPKRQRREVSMDGTGEDRPAAVSNQVPSQPLPFDSEDVDEIQQRIDEIVNASNNQTSFAHPPLSRRASQRQQWAGPSQRRPSSTSNRHGPPSRRDSYSGHDSQQNSSSTPRAPHDHGSGGGLEELDRRGAQDQATRSREQSNGSCESRPPAHDEDDEKIRRSGSEEGEV